MLGGISNGGVSVSGAVSAEPRARARRVSAMKPARQFGPLPHVRARPELSSCPQCGGVLTLSHPVWAKVVQTLRGAEHLTNLGFRCSNAACSHPQTVYHSAHAEARQVKAARH